ncbi:unnamed protein product [Rotaria sp. Silwood2]|nr:unnamed protein product [Rotaria sp. Silwood2]
MVCNDGPTTGICRFLGSLLGALFNEATHCRKFKKAVDVIHALEFYQKSGQLQPNTLFASFNIDDLCIRFSHEQAINALERFLNAYVPDHHIQGMTIDTILQLARLVLENQYFIYNYKLYQQTMGGASGSPLTIPLVYIYLFYWQQDLMNDLVPKNELFVRYQDEAFITWNRSQDELHTLLVTVNSQLPQLMWNTTSIGSKIHFRDIELGHHHALLYTQVYHERIFDNDLLPSFLDAIQLPIHDTWRWLRANLLRAVRYCSNDELFDNEIDEIKVTLHRHGFSNDIFEEGLNEFLEDFGVMVAYPPFIRTRYEIIRQHIFNHDKYREAKKKQRKSQQQQQQEIILRLPYTFEWSSKIMSKFEQELNNLLKEHFGDHPRIKDFWIKILHYHCSSLPINDVFVKRQPPISYLTLSDEQKHKQYHH